MICAKIANLDDSEVVIRHQGDREAVIADNGDRFEEAFAHPDRDYKPVNDTSVIHDEVADMIRREIN